MFARFEIDWSLLLLNVAIMGSVSLLSNMIRFLYSTFYLLCVLNCCSLGLLSKSCFESIMHISCVCVRMSPGCVPEELLSHGDTALLGHY